MGGGSLVAGAQPRSLGSINRELRLQLGSSLLLILSSTTGAGSPLMQRPGAITDIII